MTPRLCHDSLLDFATTTRLATTNRLAIFFIYIYIERERDLYIYIYIYIYFFSDQLAPITKFGIAVNKIDEDGN